MFYFATQILLDKKMVGGQVPLIMTQKQGHDQDMGLNRPVADRVPEKVLSMPKSREQDMSGTFPTKLTSPTVLCETSQECFFLIKPHQSLYCW